MNQALNTRTHIFAVKEKTFFENKKEHLRVSKVKKNILLDFVAGNKLCLMKKSILVIVFIVFLNLVGFKNAVAQDTSDPDRVEMADNFRQEGKIYVVVAIIGIVLGGILIYTIRIDKKIQRLEDEFRWNGKPKPEDGILEMDDRRRRT